MACFVPANPPEVNASANPFSGMSMGAVATIYTAWTMVGVRRGEQRTKRPTLTHILVPQSLGQFRQELMEKLPSGGGGDKYY